VPRQQGALQGQRHLLGHPAGVLLGGGVEGGRQPVQGRVQAGVGTPGELALGQECRDGSRLAVGSPVLIAGVRVGEISGLTLEGPLARIDMTLQDDINIPVDSWVTKRAYSPFGDSYVEIIPTGGDVGAPTAQRLRSPRAADGP
jgi:ABC-type transporter Mla subunit MlaD